MNVPHPPFFLTPDGLAALRDALKGPWPRSFNLSLDTGQTVALVTLHNEREFRIGDAILPLPEQISAREDSRSILKWNGTAWEKWQRFDPFTGKFYKMVFVAAGKPPTVEISGIKMHVTQQSDPQTDTRRKLHALGRLRGRVLDTCMGLGYTAIAAAARPGVQRVVVCEADRNMLRLCRENPWSAELFGNPRIQPLLIRAETLASLVPDAYFHQIIHDPPRFALAPALYSLNFYRELFRILAPRGTLYHYTGDPNRAVRRKGLPEKTAQALRQAGFRKVKKAYMGVKAQK